MKNCLQAVIIVNLADQTPTRSQMDKQVAGAFGASSWHLIEVGASDLVFLQKRADEFASRLHTAAIQIIEQMWDEDIEAILIESEQ